MGLYFCVDQKPSLTGLVPEGKNSISSGHLTYVFQTVLWSCVTPKIIHDICCIIKLKYNTLCLTEMLDSQLTGQQLMSHKMTFT